MKIFVDADACPHAIKEIILRASARTKTPVVFIANKPLTLPNSNLISSITVQAGFDVADDAILAAIKQNDLCITADIPLADAVIKKGAHAISQRGIIFTAENIADFLCTRDLKEELRDAGIMSKGPKSFSQKDKHAFANALDKILAHYSKSVS